MPADRAASIADLLLGLVLSSGAQARNRVTLEGLACGPAADGAFEFRIDSVGVSSLRIASGPLAASQLPPALLDALQPAAAAAAPEATAAGQAPSPWKLDALAGANGAIRAKIVDAHMLFDADVTVPIRQGHIEFQDATVEHVGPDSRMGVSRLGVYVDAPNGRSYLYQFASTPVAGVEFERRGALLGALVSDRGRLQLQPFGEWLLRQGSGAHGGCFTAQSRQLFDRTSVTGEVRLGDGVLAARGLQAELVGRAEGRNTVGLQSQSIGRGLTVTLSSLAARNVLLEAARQQLRADEASGSLTLQVVLEGTRARFALELADLKIAGVRIRTKDPAR